MKYVKKSYADNTLIS